MKKYVLLTILLLSTFFMIACTNDSDIKDLNYKIDKITEEMEVLKTKNEELKKDNMQLKKENEKLKKDSSNEGTIKEEAIVSNKKVYYTNPIDIETLKQEAIDNGKQTIVKTNGEGNVLLMFNVNNEIKDLRLHKLDDKFINLDFNIESYLNKYREASYTELTSSLSNKQSLIVKAHESEGIPTDCISWIDASGKVGYYLVSYEGK